MRTDPDQLVTLTTATSEFAANAVIVVLAEAGIEAFCFGSWGTAIGVTGHVGPMGFGAPVQVRRRDLERARAELARNRSDSIDIDWDQVELGDREDDLPLQAPDTVPIFASVALWVALGLVLLVLVAGIVALLV